MTVVNNPTMKLKHERHVILQIMYTSDNETVLYEVRKTSSIFNSFQTE